MQAVFTTISSNFFWYVLYALSSALSNLRKTTEEDNENIVRSDGWIYKCMKEDIGVCFFCFRAKMCSSIVMNAVRLIMVLHHGRRHEIKRKTVFSTRQLLYVEIVGVC